MAMKKAELDKAKGNQITNRLHQAGTGAHFGKAAVPVDRRAQRELDRAAGLVPFAVKLNSELVQRLHTMAQAREGDLSAIVSDLLNRALDSAKPAPKGKSTS